MKRFILTSIAALSFSASAQTNTQSPSSTDLNLKLYFDIPSSAKITDTDATKLPDSPTFPASLSLSPIVSPINNLVPSNSVVYVRKLAGWRDPFTVPQTRLNGCSEWLKVLGAKICIVPKVETRWMDVELFVTVTGSGPITLEKLQSVAEDSIRDANTAGVVAAIVACYTSGCSAALPGYLAAFKAALVARLSAEAASIALDVSTRTAAGWSDWH